MVGAFAEVVAQRAGGAADARARRAVKMLRFLGAGENTRILHLADWGSDAARDDILCPDVLAASSVDVYGEYLSLFERARARTDEERWSYVLFKTFLPALNLTYGDRTSMAVSLELRVPYLDRALVEQAGRMPLDIKVRGGRQKWVLGEAARPWLPSSVLSRPKTGFGAPLRAWLAGELHGLMRQTLLGERFLARRLFRPEGIAVLLRDLESGRRDVAYLVWALFTFEVWARTFQDGDGAAPVPLAAS
jgi:asparagine synthase (glutamine-hydrolysing)